jgi:hypothetical protein
LAARGKAEAGGPETAGGVAGGAVVAGLVAVGGLVLLGEAAGAGVVAVGGEGVWAGCEAVAVTVAVAEAGALGDGPVFVARFAEQAAIRRATTASRVVHRRQERRGGRTGPTMSM